MATRSPRGGDNPRLPRRRFPFFTQWPLAVRADLRALVKSADSSLAGGQWHLEPAENTRLRGLGRISSRRRGAGDRADPRHRPVGRRGAWHAVGHAESGRNP